MHVPLLMPCLHVALSGKATGMHFQKSQKERGPLFFLLPCAGRGAGPRGSPGPGLPLRVVLPCLLPGWASGWAGDGKPVGAVELISACRKQPCLGWRAGSARRGSVTSDRLLSLLLSLFLSLLPASSPSPPPPPPPLPSLPCFSVSMQRTCCVSGVKAAEVRKIRHYMTPRAYITQTKMDPWSSGMVTRGQGPTPMGHGGDLWLEELGVCGGGSSSTQAVQGGMRWSSEHVKERARGLSLTH